MGGKIGTIERTDGTFERLGKDSIVEHYLSYQDTELSEDLKKEILKHNEQSESAQKYAETLSSTLTVYGSEKMEDMVEGMIDECEGILERIGITASQYSKSKTWAMWDIAKQLFYLEHPEERDEKYEVGNPILIRSKRQEIVDRHIGWEAYGAYNKSEDRNFIEKLGATKDKVLEFLNKEAKNNGTLSSKDLAALGALVRDSVNIIYQQS
jgi:hypothetical protein